MAGVLEVVTGVAGVAGCLAGALAGDHSTLSGSSGSSSSKPQNVMGETDDIDDLLNGVAGVLLEVVTGEPTVLGGGGLDLDLDLDSQAAHMSRAHKNGAQHPAGNSNRVIASQSRIRQAMIYFTYSCQREFRAR